MSPRPAPPNRAPLIDTHCVRHQFEAAGDLCRVCDQPFCGECLVYSFGPTQPPFCVNCALSAAGVRVRGARPAKVSRRELKRREKEAKARAKAEQEAAAAEPVIDWSIPGSEDGEEPDPTFSFFDEPSGSGRSGGITSF
jgi:hypothetical protein